jgi:hypothetical protein
MLLGLLLRLPLGLLLPGCSPSTELRVASAPASPPLTEAHRQTALERGKAVSAETFSILSSNLLGAIQSGGVSNALPFCSLAASPLTAGIATRHGVTLRRVTHKPRNPTNRADAAELAVIQSYQGLLSSASISSTNLPPPTVTNMAPGRTTFFAPILLSKELCLKCHGNPGKDIAAGDLEIIRRLYSTDEATGFVMGELRGLWRIDFPTALLDPKP